MSGKTLSNGTLSLRFMQNAQRTKQQTQVQLEEAKIIDDAEWQVSQEVRDSWASAPSSSSDGIHRSSVTQEPSYLPFVFGTEHTSGGFKGRRSFKRGKEVTGDETLVPKPDEQTSRDTVPRTTTELGSAKRPVSISGFKANATPNSKTPRVAARSLIAQDTDVGTDMKSSRRRAPAVEPAVTDVKAGFVKPSGVDAPPAQRTGTHSRAESIISLAKSEAKKRSRDEGEKTSGQSAPATDVGQDEAFKRKKKKAAPLDLEG